MAPVAFTVAAAPYGGVRAWRQVAPVGACAPPCAGPDGGVLAGGVVAGGVDGLLFTAGVGGVLVVGVCVCVTGAPVPPVPRGAPAAPVAPLAPV